MWILPTDPVGPRELVVTTVVNAYKSEATPEDPGQGVWVMFPETHGSFGLSTLDYSILKNHPRDIVIGCVCAHPGPLELWGSHGRAGCVIR